MPWEASQPARAEAAASVLALEAELPAAVLAATDRSIIHATFANVENTLLLAEPKDLRLGLPRPCITTFPDGDTMHVRLESDELVLSVMLWLEGADAAWSDNFFHLLPGAALDVRVQPAEPMAAAEVMARRRWRAL